MTAMETNRSTTENPPGRRFDGIKLADLAVDTNITPYPVSVPIMGVHTTFSSDEREFCNRDRPDPPHNGGPSYGWVCGPDRGVDTTFCRRGQDPGIPNGV
ncbi:MAG: hypothetical protein Tsb0013_17900 [Phycisphaerales bacterium]